MSTPYSPQNVVLQTGNSQNLVSWDLTVGATSYVVNRSTDGVTFTTVGLPTTNGYLDTAVVIGTNYFYTVAAVNGANTSPFATSYPTSITPCAPGQMNLGYIRYLSKLRADKLPGFYLTLDEWNSNINLSIGTLGDILTTHFGDNYFFAPQLVFQATGLQFYPVPDGTNYPVNGTPSPALYKLLGMDVLLPGGQTTGPNQTWTAMPRFNDCDRDKYNWPGGGSAFFINYAILPAYQLMGQFIEIIPQISGQSFRMRYVPITKQLLLDTDMLPFSFSGWVEYVILDAAKKAYLKQRNAEQVALLDESIAVQVQRIETAANNRDMGQPRTTSRVRARMGDPGFGGMGNGGFGGSGGFGGFGF